MRRRSWFRGSPQARLGGTKPTASDSPYPEPRPHTWNRTLRRVPAALLAGLMFWPVACGSRSVAALLARLVLVPQCSHAREELIELLWPGVALAVGRNRLRRALFTLRQLLEPAEPTSASAPALLAARLSVRVAPGAFETDVQRFERCLRDSRPADAFGLFAGELLPGFYDEWIHTEQLRLAALFKRAGAGANGAGTAGAGAACSTTSNCRPMASARSWKRWHRRALPTKPSRWPACWPPARDPERAVQIAAFAQAFWRTRLGPSRPASACRPPPTTASCFAGGAWQRAGSMRSASTPWARPKRP